MSPKNAEESDRKTVLREHRGSLDGNAVKPPEEKKSPAPDTVTVDSKSISVADLVKALTSIPGPVKAIIKLSGSDINKFNNVLSKISKGLIDLSEDIDADKLNAVTTLLKCLEGLTTFVKNMAKLTILVPIALIGATLTGVLLTIFSGFCAIIGKIPGVEKGVEKIDKMTGLSKTLINFALAGIALTAVTFAAGLLLATQYPVIIKGFLLISGVLLGYTGVAFLAGLVAQFIKLQDKHLLIIVKFAMAGIALIALTAVVGAFAEMLFEPIIDGFKLIAGVLLAYSAVAILTGFVAQRTHAALNQLKYIIIFAVSGVALVALTAFVGFIAQKFEEEISEGFRVLSVTLLGILALSALIRIVGTASKSAIISLLLIEGLVIGGALILLAIIGTDYIRRKANVEWSDIFITLGAIALIITGVGLIAAAASLAAPFIVVGAIAIAAIEAVMIGASLMLLSIIGVEYIRRKANIEWEDVYNVISSTAGIIKEIGEMAAVAGVVAPLIAIGSVAILAIIGVVGLMSVVTLGIIGINLLLKKESMTMEDVGATLRGVTGLFTKENLDLKLSLLEIAELDLKYLAIIPIMASLTLSALAVGAIVKILGNMDAGGKIRPLISTDKDGNAKYGEPVDVIKVCSVLTDAIRTFAVGLADTFKNISGKELLKLDFAMVTLNLMVRPVSKFAEMLTSFQSDTSGKKIRAVKFKEDGTMIETPFVDIVDVSNQIATAIGLFGSTLFSDANVDGWMKNILKKSTDIKNPALKLFVKTDAEKAMGILATIITPVTGFTEMLSTFMAGDDNGLAMPIYDNEGKLIGSRPVPIVQIASTIAQAITNFATELFVNHAEEWSKLGSRKGKILGFIGKSDNERAVGIFSDIINPVCNFVSLLMELGKSPDGIGTVDKDGNVITVDVVKVASNIASAVSIFIKSLSSAMSNNKDMETFDKNASDVIAAINRFGTDIKVTDTKNLTNYSAAISAAIMSISVAANAERAKILTSFGNAIKTTSSGMKEFDKVVSKGADARKKNLEAFGEALDSLKSKLSDMSDGLEVLRDVIVVTSNADAGKIQETAQALGQLSLPQGSAPSAGGGNSYSLFGGSNNGSSNSIDKDTLVAAIREALGGVSIMTSVNNDSEVPVYSTTGDAVADAIMTALTQMQNKNVSVSSTLAVPSPVNVK